MVIGRTRKLLWHSLVVLVYALVLIPMLAVIRLSFFNQVYRNETDTDRHQENKADRHDRKDAALGKSLSAETDKEAVSST